MTWSTIAKETIAKLDEKPRTADRSFHKFRMIRLSERDALGVLTQGQAADAIDEVQQACDWIDQNGG